jgi:UDP-N-acetylmuramoyl-L-alanyl-D-glutamate--2,6-diaminopimelate ligase
VDGIDFDVAVFTNLTRDHLDYHGSMEAYFEAKARLFRELRQGDEGAVAVVNLDDPWGRRLAKDPALGGRLLTFGADRAAAVRAEDVRLSARGSAFRAVTPWGSVEIETALLGRFNVSNLLAALAAAGAAGVNLELAARVLSGETSIPGRLEVVEGAAGVRVFVDYAHTDDALRNVLQTLRELAPRRLIVVFGCGGNRDATKRSAMGRVASELADRVILTSDNPRNEEPRAIIAQIEAGLAGGGGSESIVDRREAIGRAVELADPGDIVLIAGKGHETFQEFANKTVPFDDRKVAEEMMQRAADG